MNNNFLSIKGKNPRRKPCLISRENYGLGTKIRGGTFNTKLRDKIFDVLTRSDGSGMDKTVFINQLQILFREEMEKIIGEDEPETIKFKCFEPFLSNINVGRNRLRQELRKRLSEL